MSCLTSAAGIARIDAQQSANGHICKSRTGTPANGVPGLGRRE